MRGGILRLCWGKGRKGGGKTRKADGQGMTRQLLSGGLLALLLLGCAPGVAVQAPARADLGIEVIRLSGDGPPKGPAGACWASDITPAVIETVTEQVLVTPEVRDEAGRITTPAAFRTDTRQRMVQDREEVWFRAPCPDEIDIEFVATLQRALKARGLYLLPLSGVIDAPTRDAIRRFQAERGLDSPTLSLAAAQELGIVATGLDQL